MNFDDILSHNIDLDPYATIQQQTQAATYVVLCALTVMFWDWILSLAEEYRIVEKCGLSVAAFAYLLARITTGALCVLSLIFFRGASGHSINCAGTFLAIGSMAGIGSAAKAYLWLIRVRAVYSTSKLVAWFIGIGWLLVVGTRMTVGLLTHASPVAQTTYCTVTNMGILPTISIWFNLIYDTCIFVSISVRLTSQTTPTASAWVLSFIQGNGLPRTARHILKEGQLYYITTISFSLLAAIVAVSPVSPIFQNVFSIPALAMETNMTCKAFRGVVLYSTLDIPADKTAVSVDTCINTAFELNTILELGPETGYGV